MDLLDFVPKTDTIVVQLTPPGLDKPLENKDGSVMSITLFAPYTDQYQGAMSALVKEGLAQAKAADEAGDEYDPTEPENLRMKSAEFLSSITVDWNITMGGEQLSFSVEKAKEVYSTVFWIRPLIEGELKDSTVFTNA